ncbi:SRPBCC domain-containing protein [Microbacterium sp. CFH 90308]|uniref:SRPBCC domain-containing protein n=1 Tax=Microbacterium salsuginis TaxID=2722803 RepID=A0ABX1KEL9_9MICO|nr:SRPBCC domain-containing protein [Microbacterium sp. CFH 90308]NLP84549.1 SRPBCC domain-containing protein [Microbacterium sp. CFH 90308]
MSSPDELTRIEVDQYFPHAPARVWRALTTPELMAQWLMPNDFEPVVGHRFTFRGRPVAQTGFSGRISCRVLDLVPQKRLQISWNDADEPDGMATTVTWTLQAEGKGTRLFLEHAGFDPDDPTQQLARKFMNGGWRSHVLRRLSDLLMNLT